MKVESTRTSGAVRLQHAAATYTSQEHLLELLVPLITGGLARGEPVALAVTPSTEEALYSAMGSPPGLIGLAQPESPDGVSGQTLAARRARELRELTSMAGSVTVLNEHWSRLDGADGGFWTELDAAVNVALADLPVGLTCFYPEMPLHLSVLDGARCNHPQLLVDGELRHNPDHRRPREVLVRHPVASAVLLGAPDLQLRFQAWQLQDVRRAVRALAGGSGFDEDRIDDVVLAVNEVATNAVEHGGATSSGFGAELSLWAQPDALVCEVRDHGPLADPLPGLLAPHPSDPRGRGLWIARQLCDLLHVWNDGTGTHVRIRAAP